jgi:hypothetical protein
LVSLFPFFIFLLAFCSQLFYLGKLNPLNMKKYVLLVVAVLLTAAAVTATVLTSNKKPAKAKKECSLVKKGSCSRSSTFVCQ